MKNMKQISKILFILLTLVPFTAALGNSKLEKRLDQMESELFDLKINKALDKFQWSGSTSTAYQDFNNRGYNSGLVNREFNFMNSELRLNTYVDVSERIKFFSTLKGSWYHNKNIINTTVTYDAALRRIGNNDVSVHKAYFDFELLKDELTFSLGKLPTSFGPPLNYSQGDNRTGTYPLLSYSVPLDGLALTWNTGKRLKLKDKFMNRALYHHASGGNNSFPTSGPLKGSRPTNQFGLVNETRAFSLMSEYETRRIPHIGKFTLIGQFIDFRLGSFQPTQARGLLNYNKTLAAALGVSEVNFDNNLYELYSDDKKLLEFTTATLSLELVDIANTNIDFYFTGKKSRITPKGKIRFAVVESNNTTINAAGYTAGSHHQLGNYLLKKNQNMAEKGTTILVGSRYNHKNKHFFGYEHVRGSYGSMPTSLQTQLGTEFYNVIGHGNHYYYIWKITGDNLRLRAGYRNYVNEMIFNVVSYSDFGPRIEQIYSQMELRF